MTRSTTQSKKKASPGRPRTKPAEVRAQELMDAGEQRFLERGIAATSIDDIAKAANVAKGTFYLYFQSKDELVAALRERYVHNFQQQLEAHGQAAGELNWLGRMDRWIEGVVSLYLDTIELHDLLFHSIDHHPERRESEGDGLIVRDLAARLSEGTRAGAWQVDDPEMTAVLIYHAFHGALDHAALTKGPKPSRKTLIEQLRAFFRRVVAINPEARHTG
ncbi:MAG: TetR/AcrR family transcriptional regulator [Ectothiorhodospiraceae bacterium]|nr:TetR/AcrR family transcriptional regulator [Ectothiorhodospiraceae bacterium]